MSRPRGGSYAPSKPPALTHILQLRRGVMPIVNPETLSTLMSLVTLCILVEVGEEFNIIINKLPITS